MLKIFYGRDNINKDAFIYAKVKAQDRALLIVPDQFTLQAERDAIKYMEVKGLMGIEVISMSRLQYRVLSELGGLKKSKIDKYGRHMLLAKIVAEENEKMELYRNLYSLSSFLEMTNNFISEMKQYDMTPALLLDVIAGLEGDSILKRKLIDMQRIFEKYEELLEGKYLDSEDYIDFVLPKISKSELVKNAVVWIYGFDYFAPKNLAIINELIGCTDVNIVLTYDEKCRDEELFDITGAMIFKLTEMSKEQKISYDVEKISDQFLWTNHAQGLEVVERELFSLPVQVSESSKGITLIKAANLYGEAESAAAYIRNLTREKGLGYSEILVICNDLEIRGSIIKRVFEEYDLPVFIDNKRSILHNAAVIFVLSLMDMVAYGYRNESVFDLLKTGFMDFSQEKIEALENYVIKYKVQKGAWKKEFTKGTFEYEQEEFESINESRKKFVEQISIFEEAFKKSETVREKITALYLYLCDEICLPEKLRAIIELEENSGNHEIAMENSQVFKEIVNIFDQFVELIGEETAISKDLTKIMRAGLENVEIGMLPPTEDILMVGTMQRTRAGDLKAIVILGANEGVLPARAKSEGILNEDEKIRLFDKGVEIAKLDDFRVREENLAIYKTLSKATDYLYVSCSASDAEGKEIKESPIYIKIKDIFPKEDIKKDILNSGKALELINARDNAVKHLSTVLRSCIEGNPLPLEWEAAVNWYVQNETEIFKLARKGLFYKQAMTSVNRELIQALYGKNTICEITLSPSSIERFSRCPFSFFITYGLRPEERRPFEVAGREMGDIYHKCLMEMSKRLTTENVEITAPQSEWMKISQSKCKEMIADILEKERLLYKGGLLKAGNEEEYRAERIRKVCSDMTWILVQHIRNGQIKSIFFEEPFGKADYKKLPPIIAKVDNTNIYIEGKIDRVDYLSDGSVKIIDYKTGKEKFDLQEVKDGWRLQLMLYLKAAMVDSEVKPAGVFYFRIEEPQVDASSLSGEELREKIQGEIRKNFKLDGIMLDDPEVIKNIAGEFTGYSDIAPLRATAEGVKGTSSGRLLTREEFDELEKGVDETVDKLCKEFLNGKIEADPKRTKDTTACEYCQYRNLCLHDH